MDAYELESRLVRGNEFKNEDIQYMYSDFCRQWKLHIHKVVLQTLKATENNTDVDARVYFESQLMFALISDLNDFSSPDEREIEWGIFIAKIAHILSTELQVDIVYKVSL